MLPVALMAVSCSDETKDAITEEESSANQLKSVYAKTNRIELWTPGETIYYSVSFKGSSLPKGDISSLVADCVDEMMNYANVKFVKTKERNAQVRFQFHELITDGDINIDELDEVGCQSIGKRDFKNGSIINIYDANQRTEHNLRHVILHKLGHVLGLQDEIYNQNFFMWISDQYGQDMLDPNDLNDKYLTKYMYYYDRGGVNEIAVDFTSGEFDQYSVMMCSIPKKYIWVWGELNCVDDDIKGVAETSTLSAGDKEILMRLYPFTSSVYVPIYVGSDSKSNCALGTFDMFPDKSTIRKKIGYGYKIPIAGKTCPLYKYENRNNPNDVRYGVHENLNVYKIVGEPIAHIYDNMYYNRTPLVVYYNNSNKYVGLSYVDDPYMLGKGYRMMGDIAAVITEPE